MSAFTAEEAARKWCPFARLEGCNRVVIEIDGPISQTNKCLGPGRATWRWRDPQSQERSLNQGGSAIADGEAEGWATIPQTAADRSARIQRQRRPFPNRSGFCGLASEVTYR